MSAAAPELPIPEDQTAFNLARWDEICANPILAQLEFRVESNAHGNILMTPPPAPEHGEFQSQLVILLNQMLPDGRIITECPISTIEGVKAADVSWSSKSRRIPQAGQSVLTVAPEICIEVLSPSNTQAEIDEKKSLYFEAGADEVWICGLDGTLRVFLRDTPAETASSLLCPDLPAQISTD